jgi:hypothetical protein
MHMFRWLTLLILVGGLSCPVMAADTPPEPTPEELGQKLYDAGLKHVRKGRYKKAMETFEKALPYASDSSDIFYYLVQIAEKRKMYRKTVLYGQGFLFLEPRSKYATEIQTRMAKAHKILAKMKFTQVNITFNIAPKGLEIRLNHVPVAISYKKAVPIYPGIYKVSCKAMDYQPFKKVFTVKKDTPMTVKGKMKKIIATGLLSIKSSPAKDVIVYIDNKKVGVTPLKPIRLRKGKYLVRFEKSGWDRWHRYVVIENNETYNLNPAMERTPPGKSPYRIE